MVRWQCGATGRSRSLTADWSVIVVFDRAPMAHGEGPEVVAQWRGHTDFDLLAWNAARIAKYYDNALLVIESNTLETHDPDRSGGSEQSSFILNRLRDAYDNLYARKRNEDEIRQGAPVRYGFHTNVNTKPMVISMLVQAIRMWSVTRVVLRNIWYMSSGRTEATVRCRDIMTIC